MAVPVDSRDFLPLFPEETETAIRDRYALWANEGLDEAAEDDWVDVTEGGMFWIATAPGVRERAREYDLLGTEFVAAGIPFWSWGEYLDDHALPWEVIRLAATPASGEVTFFAPAGSVIDAGLVVAAEPLPGDPSPVAREYETLVGGVVEAPLAVPAAPTVSDGGLGGGLSPTTTYYYKVTALSAEGETPAGPNGSAATTTTHLKLALNWPDIAGATGYRVYRATASGGPYDFLAERTTSDATDDGTVSVDPSRVAPTTDTSGDELTLPVQALLPGSAYRAAAGAVTIPFGGPEGMTASNAEPILGGTDVETDTSLLERLLVAYKGRGPGTSRDYEAWARAFPGVGQATAIPVWDGPGTVLVIVATEDGEPVSTDVLDALQAYLDPVPSHGDGAAPIGPTVTVATAVLLDTTITATIVPADGYSLDGSARTVRLREAIETSIDSYLRSLKPGDSIVISKVSAAIVDVAGVADISGVRINGGTVNVALGTDPAQVPNPLPSVLS